MLRLVVIRALASALLLSAAASTVWAAEGGVATDVTELLSSQARYWESQNRYDLARENWLKLLRSQPHSVPALEGLIKADALSGRTSEARAYLDRLKQAHPSHADLGRMEDLIRQGSFNISQLEQPRSLARAGKYREAVEAYRKVFGDEIPSGRLGLEFYQTLAGAENGWESARVGIAKLADSHKNEPIYRLALAQHLTYRESTRREGIDQLSTLQGENTVGVAARQAWRQGLLWLAVKPGDEALYIDYLRRVGEDTQVSARLQSLRQTSDAAANARVTQEARQVTPEELRGNLVRQGFAALDLGQFDLASGFFADASAQYGESADAIAGLGIVHLRKLDYAHARQLLERATALDKKRASRWKDALDTAKFWEAVELAQVARKSGDAGKAEQQLRAVISTYPQRVENEQSVLISLADILNEQGQIIEAEKIYRQVIRRSPENVDALRGLMSLLAGSKRLAEAITLSEALPESIRGQLGSLGVLKSQHLREQAAESLRVKDELQAEALLKDALLLDPDSPWARLDLARLYQGQGRTREANTLIDAMLLGTSSGSRTVQPEILFIKASLLAEQQDFLSGLNTLEEVSAGERSLAMVELQKRLWVRYEAQRATVYSRAGQPQDAMRLLAKIEPWVGESPELLGALASAYADVGDEGRALRYMRQALARNNQSDAGLRLAYAGLLFKLQQDAELEIVLVDLLRRDTLNEQQMQDLDNLRIGYRLRQADLLREERDLAKAYEYIEPLIRANPTDPRLIMSLARLYNDAKDYDNAYRLYQRVLQQDSEEIDAYKGAVSAALALNRLDDADALLEKVFVLDPNNPRLYALAGRAARARGDEGRALQLLQQALRLDAEQTGDKALVPKGNSQPILQLIAPPSNETRASSWQRQSITPAQHYEQGKSYKQRFGVVPRRLGSKNGISTRASNYPRGDVSLSAYRPSVGRLLKVSTPPSTPQQSPSIAVDELTTRQPQSSTGYWTEEPRNGTSAPSYRYVESLTLPRAGGREPPAGAARQYPASEFPQPRRITPSMSRQLSLPGSLRSATGQESKGSRIYEAPQNQGSTTVPYSGSSTSYRGGAVQGDIPPPPTVSRISQPDPAVLFDPLLSTPEFVLDRNRTDSKERRDLLKEVGELRASRTPYAEAGTALRARAGAEGLDRLQDIEAVVEASFPATDGGRFKLRAAPVYLDGGTVSGNNLPLYGGLGLALALGAASSTSRYENSASGIAVGIGYEAGGLKLDIGSSPLGFPVETIVGGINWRPKFDRLSFRIDIARRSVNDSLLSYAGQTDPATGLVHGGVAKTGGRLDIAYDLGKYGLYGNGSYHTLDGVNVQQNTVVELGGGLYARAIERRGSRVTYGLNVTTFGYDRNLRRFTFGHGGYFSPQSYLAVSMPVEWEGYGSRFSYKLGGAIGLQAFSEDSQAFYPGDAGLQSALTTALVSYTGTIPIVDQYSSQRQIGVGFKLDGQFEYLLDPNLALGARLALDNARNYNETSAFGYLRYMFYPQSRVAFPPKLLLPYFTFGDPRL